MNARTICDEEYLPDPTGVSGGGARLEGERKEKWEAPSKRETRPTRCPPPPHPTPPHPREDKPHLGQLNHPSYN